MTNNFPTINALVKNIFQDKYEYGLDYLQLLLFNPTQKLPALNIYGEAMTYKTTFTRLIDKMLQNNFTRIPQDYLASTFRGDWIRSRAICVEIGVLSIEEKHELITMQNAESARIEKQGKDAEYIDFNGCFILESNFLDDYYNNLIVWNLLQKSNEQTKIAHSLLFKEVDAFKEFLSTRSLFSKCEDRLWFNPLKLA